MLYVKGIISLIYVDDVLLFVPDQGNIDEIIKVLEDTRIYLNFEYDVCDFLGM